MAKSKKILLPQNAWGNDAWFVELTDNPGCFFHLIKKNRDGKCTYLVRQSYIGAAVFTEKEGNKFLQRVRGKYPNARLVTVRQVVGNDGTLN